MTELTLLMWGLAIFSTGVLSTIGLVLFGMMCYSIKGVVLRHASLLRMIAAWWWYKTHPDRAISCLKAAREAEKQKAIKDQKPTRQGRAPKKRRKKHART